jgi:hypothetical protein
MVIVGAFAAGLLSAPPAHAQADTERPKEELGRVRIQYDPPRSSELQPVFEQLKQHQTLEIMQLILSPMRLPPEGLLIKTLECKIINSWYNRDDPGDRPTVHMCYELMRNIVKTTQAEDVRLNVTQHDAIVGQFLFWTLHETGHAAFDIYQLPILGREEDAADLFAGYLMLHFNKDQARRWVEGAAYSAEEFVKDFGQMNKYASVHGLAQQRFFNLICLAFGADPKTFADVTTNTNNSMTQQGVLPARRAGNCAYEFASMDRAFKTLIAPHVDRGLAKQVMERTWFTEPRPDSVPPEAAAIPEYAVDPAPR